MQRIVYSAIALSVICIVGGYVEHGTPGGAWTVIWLVPVVCAAIEHGLHKDQVNKEYRRMTIDRAIDRKRFMGEMAIRRYSRSA